MKNRWVRRSALLFLGAAGGYAYYHFIGCTTGTCPITSNPYSSIAWGSLIALSAGWTTRADEKKS